MVWYIWKILRYFDYCLKGEWCKSLRVMGNLLNVNVIEWELKKKEKKENNIIRWLWRDLFGEYYIFGLLIKFWG